MRNGGRNARGREVMIDAKDAIKDPTVMMGTFLVNSLYVNIIFDSGAEKSFITPKFRKKI